MILIYGKPKDGSGPWTAVTQGWEEPDAAMAAEMQSFIASHPGEHYGAWLRDEPTGRTVWVERFGPLVYAYDPSNRLWFTLPIDVAALGAMLGGWSA